MSPFVVPEAVLARAGANVVQCYPAEGCGWLLARASEWWVHPVANRLAKTEPQVAQVRFEMDAAGLVAALKTADRRRARLAAMFHSHVDSPAVPSAADVAAWAPDGAPLYPGTVMLIAQVSKRSAQRASRAESGGPASPDRAPPVHVADWRAYRWSTSGLLAVPIVRSRDGSALGEDNPPPPSLPWTP